MLSTAPRPLILAASLLAGVTYTVSSAVAAPLVVAIIWKGAGVALLALYAATTARSYEGWLLAAIMALHACGDMVLDAVGYAAGALVFMAGHVIAIWLYSRNRRAQLTRSQALLAMVTVPASIWIAFAFTYDIGVGVYTAVVATMAATAWISRFPRYRVGLGAMAFLVSDLLIFARMGPFAGDLLIGYAIWILYFSGQVLITIGVASVCQADQSPKSFAPV
jgi:uncharacterized membrane protein YhhN